MMSVILFVILVLMTSLNDVTAEDSVSRRSDDNQFQSLMTLVQQQAATLQRQEASMEAMRNHISVLERSLNSNISALQSLVSGNSASLRTVSTRVGKQAAFSVKYSGMRYISVGSGATFKYDGIITNVGNGYDRNTGVFTAPYAGIYTFLTSLRSSNNHPWIKQAIFKGSTRLVETVADGSNDRYNAYDKGTAFVTTHVNQGDRVYVRQVDGGTWIEAGPYTTFTGMLVSAD